MKIQLFYESRELTTLDSNISLFLYSEKKELQQLHPKLRVLCDFHQLPNTFKCIVKT